MIGYFSKAFSESQSKLSATDKELEGLREAVKYFRPYILDRKLILRVDHRPIVEISKAKHLNARLFRIYELLSTFDLTVEYIPGRTNVISDSLSRVREPGVLLPSLEQLELPSGMKEVEIPGGGDCLVKSFARVWLEDQDRHLEVRRKTVNKIKANVHLFPWLEVANYSKVLKYWEMEGVPLPLEFTSGLALAYDMNIEVHQAGGFPLLFKSQKSNKRVHIALRDGIHMNAVCEESVKILCLEATPGREETGRLKMCPGLSIDSVKRWQEDQAIQFTKNAVESGWSRSYAQDEATKRGLQATLKPWNGLSVEKSLLAMEV